MNTMTKRILTTGAIAAIILLSGWLIFTRFMASRITLGFIGVSRHGVYPHSTINAGTLLFVGIIGAGLLLLLVVGLLQSKQLRTDLGVSDSVKPQMDDVCPGCGSDVKSNWNLCPYCGYEFP